VNPKIVLFLLKLAIMLVAAALIYLAASLFVSNSWARMVCIPLGTGFGIIWGNQLFDRIYPMIREGWDQ
jgi:hypothetical protein